MPRGQAGPTAPGWSCPEFCLQLLLSSSALRQNLQLAQCPTHAKGNALRCSSASCQMSGFRKVSLLQCQRSSVPTPSLLTADQHLQFHTLAPDSLSDAPSGCPQIKSIHWHNFTAQAISSLPLPCTMQTLSFLRTGSGVRDQIEVLVCWKADPALAPSADLWGVSRTCFAFYRLFPWCTEVPTANSAAAELQKIA